MLPLTAAAMPRLTVTVVKAESPCSQLKCPSDTIPKLLMPATIKFYLRSGLLEAGEAINPTRADYGERHVRRLQLIQGLRSTVGLGLEDIRRILGATAGAGASDTERLALLSTVQSVVLGLGGRRGERSPKVDALVRAMGWPHEQSDARLAVDEQVAAMDAVRLGPDVDVLAAYGRAADGIADAQLSFTAAQDDLEGMILTAAIGMHMHHRLILKLVALAQASHAIRRYLPQQGPDE